MPTELHVVTGAFGFSGRYLARRLLDAGLRVRTLTNSPDREHDFGDAIDVHPFNFDDPAALTESLRGAEVLYNTYWVRFNHTDFKHSIAVENTLKLFEAAKAAGVKRVVHVSISNPSEDSPLEYFSGKARLERVLRESGLSYAILRPSVLFGPEDILVNNIAWTIRKFPVFGLFGNGKYRLQPIHVDDLARLAHEQGKLRENTVVEAIGPETFTYRELVRAIAKAIGRRRWIVGLPPILAHFGAWMLGKLLRDVIVTREEIKGLMADLLYTDAPPAGETILTEWAAENRESLGVRYASELARRRDRRTAYSKL